MKYNLGLVLALCFVVVQADRIPNGAAIANRNAGTGTIGQEIQGFNQRLEDAVNRFKPVEAACKQQEQQAITQCGACVESKCKTRAEAVCKPEQWQVVLGKTVNFFKSGVPNFFSKSVPDVFVNKIGGGVVDITKDVGSFFSNNVASGVKDMGRAFGQAAGAVVNAGKVVANVASKAVDAVKDIGKSIGKVFSGWGKRELRAHHVRAKRSEPGCSAFENDPESACRTYLDPKYCSICGFNAKTNCAGYNDAFNAVSTANSQRSWMNGITQKNYDISYIDYNAGDIMPSGEVRRITVGANLFGKALTFTVEGPINPYNVGVSGPIIARKALEAYRR